jgi:hypothetical protein
MIELIFFIGVAHLIIKWLAQDKRCNLVAYFFLYTGALLITDQCALVTLHYFLYWMLPCFGTLFVIFHQEQLQKNFITITHANQKKILSNNNVDLVTTMLQIGLYNSVRKRKTFFIVEGNQDLGLFLHAAVPLNITIQKELVESVCDNSSLYNEQSAIWLDYTGIIRGINSSLMQTMHYNDEEITNHILDTMCRKTGCFIVLCDINGLWTFKNGDLIHEALSTVHIKRLCKQKIELLIQQRSFVYASSQTIDTQTTLS